MTSQKFLFTLAALALSGAAAWAQTPAPDPTPPGKVYGWTKTANVGANLAFGSSQSVVGQTDGSSQTYGLNLKGGLNHVSESHEWRNNLSALSSTSRTPSIPRWVKSTDELKLDTIYLYSLPAAPKIGPYVRGEAAAPMFKGEDVQPDVKTYRVSHPGGPDDVFNGTSVRLTDGFKPLTTKEGAGFFWRPVQDDKIKVEARVGIGALQIAANGQYIVQGVNDAGEIQVNPLSDVDQVGVELAASVKGKIDDKSAYEAGVETMSPFASNKPDNDHRDAVELTNVDGYAKLTSNITKWASFSYDYKLKIEPQLQTRAQQIHLLVLNVNYNLF